MHLALHRRLVSASLHKIEFTDHAQRSVQDPLMDTGRSGAALSGTPLDKPDITMTSGEGGTSLLVRGTSIGAVSVNGEYGQVVIGRPFFN
jgi:hypothetical protein